MQGRTQQSDHALSMLVPVSGWHGLFAEEELACSVRVLTCLESFASEAPLASEAPYLLPCDILIEVSGGVHESLFLAATVGVCIVDVREIVEHKHGLEGSDYVDMPCLLASDARERV